MSRSTLRRPTAPAGTRRAGEHGQLLVLFALAVTVVITATALLVDGGNLYAQQRLVQNGADSAAQAGAVVMAERLSGVSTPAGGWDAKVLAKVTANATANNIQVTAAYYTDICGIPLKANGAKAVDGSGREDLATALQVGTGSLPTSSAGTPDCPSLTVGPPAGVLVLGRVDAATYMAGVVGIKTIPVTQRATAVAGYLQGYCAASDSVACALLPIAIPVNTATCTKSNDLVTTGTAWALGPVYKIPLCGNSAGNVGFIDWTPKGGGAGEVVCSILHPDNPAINLPSWQFVAQPGGVDGGGGACGMSVEAALRTYDGQVVMVPQFDQVCTDDPDQTQVATPDLYGCAAGGHGGGSNIWYRMPSFAFLQLCSATDSDCVDAGTPHGAYIQGSNKTECEVGGNGATDCLVGRFVKILATGTVGAGVGGGVGGEKVVGVQLIK